MPVDGTVLQGSSYLDESLISGEPIPKMKSVEDTVIGGSMNTSSWLLVEVTHAGEDTMLSQILHLVQEAQTNKANVQKLADKISSVFVPIVIGLSLITFSFWMTLILLAENFEWRFLCSLNETNTNTTQGIRCLVNFSFVSYNCVYRTFLQRLSLRCILRSTVRYSCTGCSLSLCIRSCYSHSCYSGYWSRCFSGDPYQRGTAS